MKKVKKLSALLLSLCMAFVFVASTAFAAEQVADADGITITADTTDEAIAAAWGEGAAAISQNDDGSYTFKLLKNISLAKYQDISIGNFQAGAEQPRIILDLNGCTLSGTSIVIANLGNLTIMDGSAEQTGRIEYKGGQYLVAVNNVGYSMTIEGGTFVCNGADSAAYNSAISTAGGVTTVINGGTFEGNGAGAVISYGETVINGGTFDGAYGVVSKKTSSGETGSIVFPADSTAVINASKIAFVAQGDAASAGKVSAAGGTFNAPAVLGTIGTGVDKTSAANVTGGIYAADPSAYVPDNNASISYTHENSTVYAVGKSSIDEVAQQAQAGDTITVLSGDVALDTADKVVVKNESTGNVVVNGTTVETNTEVTAHVYDPNWKHDNKNHWHECTDCGARADESAHTYGEWKETKAATETEKGEKQRTCSVCGYVDIEEIPVLPHTHSFGTEWKSDGTSHWHDCAACGAKTDEAAHSFKWVTDKAATATEKGIKHEECTVCGYQKEAVEIPAAGTGTSSQPGSSQNGSGGSASGNVQTGEYSSLTFWIALLTIAFGGIMAAVSSKKFVRRS